MKVNPIHQKTLKKILKIICILIFVISSIALIKIFIIDSLKTKQKNLKINDIYHSNETVNDNEEIIPEQNEKIEKIESKSKEETTNEKLEKLTKINSDIVGWLYINDSAINLPVLKNPDNAPLFYLDHDYERKNSKHGSIFIDDNCKNFNNTKNIVLHGHSMKDGTMFAGLLKYTNKDFYKKRQIVTLDTSQKTFKFKIFSVFITNTLAKHGEIFNYIKSEFNDDKDFLKFVDELKKRSIYKVSEQIEASSRLITLSTCSYEYEGARTVVVGHGIQD